MQGRRTMAKLSTLIPICAHVMDLPDRTVAIYARYLREGRLISTGGRGPGGADMTPRDCANLLIAIMGTNLVKDAAKAVPKYRPLVAGRQQWRLPNMPLPALTRLSEFHQFGVALEALITAAMDGSLESALEAASKKHEKVQISNAPIIEVTVRGPLPIADISVRAPEWGENVTYTQPNPWLRTDKPPKRAIKRWEKKIERRGPWGDLQQIRLVSTQTIQTLGQLLRK